MRLRTWQKAAAFAACSHQSEFRDDGSTPYFSHPARVALIVAHLFRCDDDAAVSAALLHDVLENTDEGYDHLEDRFGKEIADLVVALTKNMMLPRKKRDKDYRKRLRKADWRARLIKLADQYDNVCDALTGRKNGLKREQTKARDILRLAKGDRRKHPESARGVALLGKLLKSRKCS